MSWGSLNFSTWKECCRCQVYLVCWESKWQSSPLLVWTIFEGRVTWTLIFLLSGFIFRTSWVVRWSHHWGWWFSFWFWRCHRPECRSFLCVWLKKPVRVTLISRLQRGNGPLYWFFAGNHGCRSRLDGSTCWCRRINGHLLARIEYKGFLGVDGRVLCLWLRLVRPWLGALNGKRDTFEGVDVLCGLKVADEETASAFNGVDDAVPVLRVDLLPRWQHFPNNLLCSKNIFYLNTMLAFNHSRTHWSLNF